MFKTSEDELKVKAYQIRKDLINLLYQTGSGHLDTSLSLVEIWLAIVYSDFFKYDPRDGSWEDRDRVFLSKGHACPLQYIVNAELGYYEKSDVFDGLRKPDTPFQGHTKRNLQYGFENSNGSLGIGLWQAYGCAIELKQNVFCIAGDGEFQEPISMGIFTVPHYLKPAANYTLIVNHNGLAQDSAVDIGPLKDVAEAYKWHTSQIDGHDFHELDNAIQEAVSEKARPSVIICNTIKGKGGSIDREGKLGSHGAPPKKEEDLKNYLDGLESAWRTGQ